MPEAGLKIAQKGLKNTFLSKFCRGTCPGISDSEGGRKYRVASYRVASIGFSGPA